MSEQLISERYQRILKAIVARYIRDGQPVGSKTIAEDIGVSLSPATIRNIMADLEEAGYIHSPHTSAGRVPTVLGYRFFVNRLLQVKKEITYQDIEEFQAKLTINSSEQELVESASSLISSLTRLTGIVTIPRHEQMIFRQIEFLSLSNNRILVILVINEQEVQNLIIQTDRQFDQSELQQAANLLTTHYSGRPLLEVRQLLLNEMKSHHQHIDNIMQTVFVTAEKNYQKQQEDYVIAGESNLVEIAKETSVNQLRDLFHAFSSKNDILHLLDQCLDTEGIQIFIGQESGFEVFDGCSLITAPYAVGDKVLGVLGVIGPTRMDYERVINAVDITAKLLSAALKERQ